MEANKGKKYNSYPIDIVDNEGAWSSTFRYEPFLNKWFYVEPSMKGQLFLMDSEDVPSEVKLSAGVLSGQVKNRYYSPIKMQIQVNNYCNYKCKMCYAAREEASTELSLDVLKLLFSELKDIGVIRVNLVGGEIFMRKDIIEIIDAAIDENLLVSCISNGVIPGKNIEKYNEILNKLFNIQVSCNGVGKNYETEYGAKSWKVAKEYIGNVIKNTKSNILSFVITEDNVHDIPLFLEFANEIKPTVIKFGSVCWSGRSKSKESIEYYTKILPYAKTLIAKGRMEYPNLQIQSQLDSRGNNPLWEDYLSGYRPYEYYFSPEGRDGLYINVYGDVFPFPLLSEYTEFKIGNIEEGIWKLWSNSSILEKIRNVTFKLSKCGELGCENPCGLWNRSYAYAWSNSLFGKVPCEFTDWR